MDQVDSSVGCVLDTRAIVDYEHEIADLISHREVNSSRPIGLRDMLRPDRHDDSHWQVFVSHNCNNPRSRSGQKILVYAIEATQIETLRV